MNRRGFFNFLVGAPVAIVASAKAASIDGGILSPSTIPNALPPGLEVGCPASGLMAPSAVVEGISARVAIFNALRKNQGCLILNSDGEKFG